MKPTQDLINRFKNRDTQLYIPYDKSIIGIPNKDILERFEKSPDTEHIYATIPDLGPCIVTNDGSRGCTNWTPSGTNLNTLASSILTELFDGEPQLIYGDFLLTPVDL